MIPEKVIIFPSGFAGIFIH